MRKRYIRTGMVLFAILGATSLALAKVPAPPVNQNLGIPDTVFNNITSAQCLICHNENSTIAKPEYLPSRHHSRIGKPIQSPTDIPYVVENGGTNATYQCLNCHRVVYDPKSGAYIFEGFTEFRECTFCHKTQEGTATVHHRTPNALAKNCKACHGPIDNPGDGHYIPSYRASVVTPRTGKGLSDNGQGGCAYCHNGTVDPSLKPIVDPASGVLVFSNAITHHSTGLALPPYSGNITGICLWCHYPNPTSPLAIRTCEECHGVNSLHNIQTDGDGKNGVVPMNEPDFWGHVGSSNDCMGCHNNIVTAASGSYLTNYTFPHIDNIDKNNLTAGNATVVALQGQGLTNYHNGTEITSTVQMVSRTDGTVTDIIPSNISENRLEFIVPAGMPPDSYSIYALKKNNRSNAVNMVLRPEVQIDKATCLESDNRADYTIDGHDFGMFLKGMEYPGSVSVSTENGEIAIQSWSANRITARANAPCDTTVTVKSTNGYAAAASKERNIEYCLKCHDGKIDQVSCNNRVWLSHTARRMVDAATAAAIEENVLGGKCVTGPVSRMKKTGKRP